MRFQSKIIILGILVLMTLPFFVYILFFKSSEFSVVITGPEGSTIARMAAGFEFEELGSTRVKVVGEEGEVVTARIQLNDKLTMITVMLKKEEQKYNVKLQDIVRPSVNTTLLGGDSINISSNKVDYLSARAGEILRASLSGGSSVSTVYNQSFVEELTWYSTDQGYFLDRAGNVFSVNTKSGTNITDTKLGALGVEKNTRISSNSAGDLAFKSNQDIYVYENGVAKIVYSSPFAGATPYVIGLSDTNTLALHEIVDRNLTEYEAGENTSFEELADRPQQITIVKSGSDDSTVEIPYDSLFFVRDLVWSPSGNLLAVVGPYNVFLIKMNVASPQYSLITELPRTIGSVVWLDENTLSIQNENSLWLTDVVTSSSYLIYSNSDINHSRADSLRFDNSTNTLYSVGAGEFVSSPSNLYEYKLTDY